MKTCREVTRNGKVYHSFSYIGKSSFARYEYDLGDPIYLKTGDGKGQSAPGEIVAGGKCKCEG